MHEIHKGNRKNIEIASDSMKQRYDTKVQEVGFQEEEFVELFNSQRREGLSIRLQRAWEGPYQVMKRSNDVVHRNQKLPRENPRVVYVDCSAPYADQNLVEEHYVSKICAKDTRR